MIAFGSASLMPGCANGSAGIGPDSGSRRDGGSISLDSGGANTDSGTFDSGSILADAGEELDDGGSILADAGEELDAGNSTIDAGSIDAGSSTIDAGTIALDAGPDAGGLPCTDTPWGTVPHGFSGTAYVSAAPTGPCMSQTRTCSNGTMSGSYTNTSCRAGCTGTPWGDVADGFSGTAYLDAVASYRMRCSTNSQTRTCTNGRMSGTYTQTSCTQYACEYMGARFPHLGARFTAPMIPAEWYECQLDGTWSAPQSGNPAALGTPCQYPLEGTPPPHFYFENTTCGYYGTDGQSYRCRSGTWELDTNCPPGP